MRASHGSACAPRVVGGPRRHLATEGYGARPLQRTLETLVVTPLARHLLDNPGLRDTTLRVGLDAAGKVTFS